MINRCLMRNVIAAILSPPAKRLLTAEPGGGTFVAIRVLSAAACVVRGAPPSGCWPAIRRRGNRAAARPPDRQGTAKALPSRGISRPGHLLGWVFWMGL